MKHALDSGNRRLWLMGLLLLAAVSLAFLVMSGIFSALSTWYGGGIAAANRLVLMRCSRRDAQAPQRSPQQSLAAAYSCEIQRFLLVALLFGFGLAVVELEPFALLVGFIVGQLVMVFFGIKQLASEK